MKTIVRCHDARGSARDLLSLSILDREVEPFDEALDRETWSLYNQRLQWDLELATDTSLPLPDGQLVVQIASQSLYSCVQKIYLSRQARRSQRWPSCLRVYIRYAFLHMLFLRVLSLNPHYRP